MITQTDSHSVTVYVHSFNHCSCHHWNSVESSSRFGHYWPIIFLKFHISGWFITNSTRTVGNIWPAVYWNCSVHTSWNVSLMEYESKIEVLFYWWCCGFIPKIFLQHSIIYEYLKTVWMVLCLSSLGILSTESGCLFVQI